MFTACLGSFSNPTLGDLEKEVDVGVILEFKASHLHLLQAVGGGNRNQERTMSCKKKKAKFQIANPTAVIKALTHIQKGLAPSTNPPSRHHLSYPCPENEASNTVAYMGHTQTTAQVTSDRGHYNRF